MARDTFLTLEHGNGKSEGIDKETTENIANEGKTI